VVATAASMNGYAAANVAAKISGVKVLVEARPPVAVLAEPSVIEQAPLEMTTAGFGDTIAKYQSNTDWLMNHQLLDEYYCEFCAGIITGLEPLYLERPEDIREGRSRAVGGLFEALFWSGVAMTVVGTSAPASGGEHLLSHTLDMVSAVQGRPHDLHGRQVGIGTIFSAALYERLLAIENPTRGALPEAVDSDYWKVPALTAAVQEQYEAKRPAVETAARKLATGDTWDRLRASLSQASQSPATARAWLKRAGGAVTADAIGCSHTALRAAALHMHEIRKRFTVVDLAWMAGVLPNAADEIIEQWLQR
jgi:glycerol-1-phosphate dehydrogenase [NAD(P)+]